MPLPAISMRRPAGFLRTSFFLRGWHGSGVPSGIAFWSLSACHTWFAFFALRAFKTSRKRKGGDTEHYQRWEAHKFFSSKLANGVPIWSTKNTPNAWHHPDDER